MAKYLVTMQYTVKRTSVFETDHGEDAAAQMAYAAWEQGDEGPWKLLDDDNEVVDVDLIEESR
jgi:hypothetical protein